MCRTRLFALASLCVVVGSCGQGSVDGDELVAPTAALAGEAVARVGGEEISSDLVAEIANAQGVNAKRALRLAVRDAVFAEAAIRAGLNERPAVRAAIRAELAKAMLVEIGRSVRAEGPVTDAELDELTKLHWLAVDRPEGFRAYNAVVIVDPEAAGDIDEETWEKGRAVAQAIRDAIKRAPEVALSSEPPRERPDGKLPADAAGVAFEEEAKTIKTDFKTEIRRIAPVCADGYDLTPTRTTYVPEFVEKVVGLRARGDLAGPFRSPFGWHVVMLLERIPEERVSASARRDLFLPETIARRAQRTQQAIFDAGRTGVELAHEVDGLLGLLNVRGAL